VFLFIQVVADTPGQFSQLLPTFRCEYSRLYHFILLTDNSKYAQYDNYDEDLGSAGLSLLDPGTFSGGGITQMALTYGKNNIVSIFNFSDKFYSS